MWKKLVDWLYSDEAKTYLRQDIVFTQIIQKACEFADGDRMMMWSNGGELLVPTLGIANEIADAIDVTLDVVTATGSYDDDTNDLCSGWHYITF